MTLKRSLKRAASDEDDNVEPSQGATSTESVLPSASRPRKRFTNHQSRSIEAAPAPGPITNAGGPGPYNWAEDPSSPTIVSANAPRQPTSRSRSRKANDSNYVPDASDELSDRDSDSDSEDERQSFARREKQRADKRQRKLEMRALRSQHRQAEGDARNYGPKGRAPLSDSVESEDESGSDSESNKNGSEDKSRTVSDEANGENEAIDNEDGDRDSEDSIDSFPSLHDSDSDSTAIKKQNIRAAGLVKARIGKGPDWNPASPEPAIQVEEAGEHSAAESSESSISEYEVDSEDYDDRNSVYRKLKEIRACGAPTKAGGICQIKIKAPDGKAPFGCRLHRDFIPDIVAVVRSAAAAASLERRNGRVYRNALREDKRKKRARRDAGEEGSDEEDDESDSEDDEVTGGPSRRDNTDDDGEDGGE
ncbi:hypothetical protein WAI453_011665 [Rhynchosporium graminicola]|uniref:Uncharacterized protein n=1 Tax=Rhynchosporium graminicola TaxID=2792576 RepID=A0A1E1K014_9HELO|nr:uncharacterized protein RCO7_07108 [Rhynchosporium commune]